MANHSLLDRDLWRLIVRRPHFQLYFAATAPWIIA